MPLLEVPEQRTAERRILWAVRCGRKTDTGASWEPNPDSQYVYVCSAHFRTGNVAYNPAAQFSYSYSLVLVNSHFGILEAILLWSYMLGAVHKVCHAKVRYFWPPPVTNLWPPPPPRHVTPGSSRHTVGNVVVVVVGQAAQSATTSVCRRHTDLRLLHSGIHHAAGRPCVCLHRRCCVLDAVQSAAAQHRQDGGPVGLVVSPPASDPDRSADGRLRRRHTGQVRSRPRYLHRVRFVDGGSCFPDSVKLLRSTASDPQHTPVGHEVGSAVAGGITRSHTTGLRHFNAGWTARQTAEQAAVRIGVNSVGWGSRGKCPPPIIKQGAGGN